VSTVTDSAASAPDLTGAVTYAESNSGSIAHGRWYVLDDDTVYFERDSTGELVRSLIAASTLRTSPTWTVVQR
jgi:hypothetical protein